MPLTSERTAAVSLKGESECQDERRRGPGGRSGWCGSQRWHSPAGQSGQSGPEVPQGDRLRALLSGRTDRVDPLRGGIDRSVAAPGLCRAPRPSARPSRSRTAVRALCQQSAQRRRQSLSRPVRGAPRSSRGRALRPARQRAPGRWVGGMALVGAARIRELCCYSADAGTLCGRVRQETRPQARCSPSPSGPGGSPP